MPEISRFYGIIIRMFYNDRAANRHNPLLILSSLLHRRDTEILEGRLPKRAKTLAIEWAIEHRDELTTNWQKARGHETLDKIEPLD